VTILLKDAGNSYIAEQVVEASRAQYATVVKEEEVPKPMPVEEEKPVPKRRYTRKKGKNQAVNKTRKVSTGAKPTA